MLRDELARVRARVDQAVAERDAALGQLSRLAEFLVRRRAVTDRDARADAEIQRRLDLLLAVVLDDGRTAGRRRVGAARSVRPRRGDG